MVLMEVFKWSHHSKIKNKKVLLVLMTEAAGFTATFYTSFKNFFLFF